MEYPKIDSLFERFADGPNKGKVDITKVRCPVVLSVSRWVFTEKINGTNIRIVYDPQTTATWFLGRTDNAQLYGPLIQHLQSFAVGGTGDKPNGPLGALWPAEDFPDGGKVVLYGEGYGEGIQGGKERPRGSDYRKGVSFRLFDVKVNQWWLEWENVQDIAEKLGINTVPELTTRSRAINWNAVLTYPLEGLKASLPDSPLAFEERVGEHSPAEGIVATSFPLLLKRDGRPLKWKMKFSDFAKEGTST